ncbi:hypothetical protein NPIL_526001 [Nephila pilipes]|uniref:Uncharacterized protein n=1 Tax=Nephila pilipes TaxID=299642 RepID=A0A8X6PYB8_NEPPI|nr:hypothetical protein NPIL_526001 [Nephila pilipes]
MSHVSRIHTLTCYLVAECADKASPCLPRWLFVGNFTFQRSSKGRSLKDIIKGARAIVRRNESGHLHLLTEQEEAVKLQNKSLIVIVTIHARGASVVFHPLLPGQGRGCPSSAEGWSDTIDSQRRGPFLGGAAALINDRSIDRVLTST